MTRVVIRGATLLNPMEFLFHRDNMSWLPIPSSNDVRKWFLIWREFKGKLVRVWIATTSKTDERNSRDSMICTTVYALEELRRKHENNLRLGEGKRRSKGSLDKNTMVITGVETVEGVIDEVIELPFGLLLKDVVQWISPNPPIPESIFSLKKSRLMLSACLFQWKRYYGWIF